MQWPGSIRRVLFVGVSLRAAMPWINSAQVCVRGPLELRSNSQNEVCALLSPPNHFRIPPLRSNGPNRWHKFCLIPPPLATQLPKSILRGLLNSGYPHAKYTHTYMNHTHSEARVVITARSEKLTRSTSEKETSVTQAASYGIQTHDLPLTERVICQLS